MKMMNNVIPKRRIRKSYSALDLSSLEVMEVQKRSDLDAAYKAYYDLASDRELEEEKAWAEFGTAQMAKQSR